MVYIGKIVFLKCMPVNTFGALNMDRAGGNMDWDIHV